MFILPALSVLIAATQLLNLASCFDDVITSRTSSLDYTSGTFPSFQKKHVKQQPLILEKTDQALKIATEKANRFIASLTLEQKSKMVTGNGSAGGCIGNLEAFPSLGFNGLCSMDGPTALNRADLISVFPAGLTAAASWDRDLIYERANALANEFRDKGVHVLLGLVL